MNEYLIFEVGDSTLGMAVSRVRQVVRAATLSPPAEKGKSIEGLLNLRGQVVPVVSLEAVMGIVQPQLSDSDFLIVLHDSKDRPFAIRSNTQVRLESTADVAENAGDPLASTGVTDGLLRLGSRIVTLLNPDKLAPYVGADHGDPSGGNDK